MHREDSGDRYLESLNMVEAGETQDNDKVKAMTVEIFNLIRK